MKRDARSLLYLFWRTTYNGIKRALTTPRRLIGLLGSTLYFIMVFIRPFSSNAELSNLGRVHAVTRFPESTFLDPLVFSIFLIASIPMAMGLLAYRGGFKPADVDVLFATPVNPKVVLCFRVARDYLVSLLLPLILAVVGMRPLSAGLTALFTGFPRYGAYVGKTLWVGWLLVALCWVSMGYAASLFVGRSDLKSDLNRRLLMGGIATIFGIVAIFVTLRLRAEFSMETMRSLVNSPVLRIPFFVASFATFMVMAPITENWWIGLVGLFGLVFVIIGSLRIALTQVGWLYDQAAAKGFSTIDFRSLQRKGDSYGIYAEQARKGKIRRGRIAGWIAKRNFPGPVALIWKDALLQARTSILMYVLLIPVFAILIVLSVQTLDSNDSRGAGAAYLFIQGTTIFFLTVAVGQNAFVELLKRVDVLKPLPFTPVVTVFYEVLAKVVPGFLAVFILSVVGVCAAPRLYPIVGATLLMAPGFGTVLTSLLLIISLLFPDFDDPTQRSFRGLMTMLGLVIVGSPSVAIVGFCFFFGINPVLYAFPVLALNLAFSAGLCFISGSLFATFNPSE